MAAKNNSNEIQITRIYDAALEDVWNAWTEPAQVAQWWGPRGFTLTTHDHNLKTGGHWNYTMHGPDGTDYENKTKYLEVKEKEKLVYDHGGNDDRPPLFRVTVIFSEIAGKTKMEMSMALPTPEAAAETKRLIKKAGGDSTWDRFSEYLIKKTTDQDKFVINRSFDVSINLMFDLWTDPKHFSQWLPPTGFKMEFIRADIKEGGSTFYKMYADESYQMYGRAKYLKIQRPDCIIYTQQFCDQKENISRHPMAPTWPETMLTTVQFSAEGPDRTRVTVTWEAYGDATADEMDTFIKSRGGMTQGWGGSFDKLDSYIEERGAAI